MLQNFIDVIYLNIPCVSISIYNYFNYFN